MRKLLPMLMVCCLSLPAQAEPPAQAGGPPADTASTSTSPAQLEPDTAPRQPIEVRYVTDRLILGMKDNPQGTGKTRKFLKSGMRLEILEKRGAYSLVRAPDGTEGWAKSAFMVKDKPAILVVDEYKAEIERLKQEIRRLEAGGKRVEIRPDPAQKQRILELEQALDEARTQLRELQAAKAAPDAAGQPTESAVLPSARQAASRGMTALVPMLAALLIGLLVGGGLAWWGYDRRVRRRFAGLRV